MKFEVETIRRVWCNESKTYIEIAPDPDGLGCVEVRYVDPAQPGSHHSARITMPPDQAILVAEQIKLLSMNMPNK